MHELHGYVGFLPLGKFSRGWYEQLSNVKKTLEQLCCVVGRVRASAY